MKCRPRSWNFLRCNYILYLYIQSRCATIDCYAFLLLKIHSPFLNSLHSVDKIFISLTIVFRVLKIDYFVLNFI